MALRGKKNIKSREIFYEDARRVVRKILWKSHELLWKYFQSRPVGQKRFISYEIGMNIPAERPCWAKHSIKSYNIGMTMPAERTCGAKKGYENVRQAALPGKKFERI